jgi:hypothetical protein
MPSADSLAPLALALLLVLAGCGGATTDEPTTNVTAIDLQDARHPAVAVEHTVTVENGTLPVNATLTLARVQALLDSDAEPWPVRVRNLSEWRANLGRVGASPLNRALGFENVSVDWAEPTGLTKFGTVYVHPGDGAAGATERVLAHEFVHLVQYRTNMLPWLSDLRQTRLTTDRLKTRQALVEGGAVYVADAYTRQYLDVETNSAYVRALYRTESATHRSALAQYRFGAQYVAHRIDDPANLSRVYEDYPRTTEQVLHNYTRAEEPPANLSVDAAGGGNWTYLGNNTLGEMAIRSALGTELPRDRAAAAATGWGTDRLLVSQHATNESRWGWVLVARWDTPAETDDLLAALDAYATARDADSPSAFRTRTLDEKTVALVFGDPAYVDRTSVTDHDGGVSVNVAG